MKTKRNFMRRLKRHTKRRRQKQKGGVGTIFKTLGKLGLGALALGATPGALAYEQPSMSSGLMSYPGASFTPSPSYSTALMPQDMYSIASPSFQHGTLTPSYTKGFANYTPSNFINPAQVNVSATPSMYVTPAAIPGPVAKVAQPVSQILETASTQFLQNALEVTAELVTESVKPQKLFEGVTLAGHNTLTTKSWVPGLVSVNQQLTLDQYMENCATTGKCFLDIDMWKSGDTVLSVHGGTNFLHRALNASEGTGGTKTVLDKVHAFAKAHPDVTVSVRSENHDVSAKDIEAMLTPEMKGQVATFSKQNVPSHGELQEKGTNIMYFLENVDQREVNQETGVFTDSVVMAQDHFFIRTNWDDIKGLTSADNIGEHMQEIDTSKLGPNPMILIDGYKSSIGADPTGHTAQSKFVGGTLTEVLPRIIEHARSKGVVVSDTTGCVIMLDNVDSNTFSYQVALDFSNQIEDADLRGFVTEQMADYYLVTQEALADALASPTSRPLANQFARPYKKWVEGKNINLNIGDAILPVPLASVLIYYLLGAIHKKACKSINSNRGQSILRCKKLDELITNEVKKHPEMESVVTKGAESGELLTQIQVPSSLLNENPGSVTYTPTSNSNYSTWNPNSPRSNGWESPQSNQQTKKKKKKSGKGVSNQQFLSSAFARGPRRGGTKRHRR